MNSTPQKQPQAPAALPAPKIPIFKVCVIGNGNVGKTTLIHTLRDKKFSQTLPTIGFETVDVEVPF